MDLDPPPMFELLLFESPWAAITVLVILSGVFSALSRKRRSKLLGVLAAVGLIAACGVYALAWAVTTDRELLIEQTHRLVAATAPLDQAMLDSLIDPTAIVSGPDGGRWLGYDQINPRLRGAVKRFGIDSQRVRQVKAHAQDTGWGESTLTVRTIANGSGIGPVNTGWRLTWRRGQDGIWRVVDIRWVLFNGQTVSRGLLP